MNKSPNITIHAFASAKGGVGKSSLAVAAAHLVAQTGRRAVIVDCDLTGSSLADGLRLRAPDVPKDATGRLDLSAAPTGRYLSLEQTTSFVERRMTVRKVADPCWVPFFNDALAFTSDNPSIDCDIAAMAWHDEACADVQYLPSSAAREDIRLALSWLYSTDPIPWTCRFAWLLKRIVSTIDGVTDVFIDLPPGLFGFSQSVLTLLAMLSLGEATMEGFPDWTDVQFLQINPFLITTPDRNDIFTTVRALGPLLRRLSNLRLVVNKDSRIEETKRAVKERFPVLGAEQLLHHLPMEDQLGCMFLERRIQLDQRTFWATLSSVLRLEGRDA